MSNCYVDLVTCELNDKYPVLCRRRVSWEAWFRAANSNYTCNHYYQQLPTAAREKTNCWAVWSEYRKGNSFCVWMKNWFVQNLKSAYFTGIMFKSKTILACKESSVLKYRTRNNVEGRAKQFLFGPQIFTVYKRKLLLKKSINDIKSIFYTII